MSNFNFLNAWSTDIRLRLSSLISQGTQQKQVKLPGTDPEKQWHVLLGLSRDPDQPLPRRSTPGVTVVWLLEINVNGASEQLIRLGIVGRSEGHCPKSVS